MLIQMVDNVELKTVSVLTSAIETATDIRIAVAFISGDGLLQIMPSIQSALDANARIEFLVGMDTRATDPLAIKDLYKLFRETSRLSLLCFLSQKASAYHPKMYLMRDAQTATAIIGSSNLTHRGLTTNIEANIVIKDGIQTEIISEIYSTYNRLKYHPSRVIPDDEFIELFSELCRRERIQESKLKRDPHLREFRNTFAKKASNLQRPKPTRNDLIGWLELVYDALPEGHFRNQDVYKYEELFHRQYPQNLNVRAKIRQQLQVLRELGFIEHISRGVWRKK